jgi:maleate cis-trans isomerase
MRQVLEFHAERRLSYPIADLGAQVGDLPKRGIEGILIGCLQLRAIKCVEVVNAQAGYQVLSNAEAFDCVEALDSQRRRSQG